jgi:FlaA1/EpsC-like NDP-sugar epimerase
MAWLLRFDFWIPRELSALFLRGLFVVLATKGMIFCVLQPRLDPRSRFFGFSDAVGLLRQNLLASTVACAVVYCVIGREFPRSVLCLDFLVCLLASGGAQFALRWAEETIKTRQSSSCGKGLLIYGAGVAGIALAREIRGNPALGYRALGFIDDNPSKHSTKVLGLPVLGCGQDLPNIVRQHKQRNTPVAEIAVAMPSATGRQIRAAVERGRFTGATCRIVPGLGELISGRLPAGTMREVSVTDLLGRERVELDQHDVRKSVTGRTILVTGAAGSIGSELCNQLAKLEPKLLIALDQAESAMFHLEAGLSESYPNLQLVTEIADIRDLHRMEDIVEHYAPDSVYHAAAYKHVPMMERNVCEAVQNNVIGTWNMVQAAWRMHVSQFVLVSSDKAVNPTSVMGLTKRVAELIVSARRSSVGAASTTRFVSVRFGNVLISNGSVVPTFEKQIARGGPVTVTHPDMRRYFMTVQEAVQLVLQSSTMGKDSEIFVLDMGVPIRILDLARKMIRLAGLRPGEDIEIKFTGLRPGEKMFEELNLDYESHQPTGHERIRVFRGRTVAFADLAPWIAQLQHLVWRRDPELVLAHLAALVPEYQSQVRGSELGADAVRVERRASTLPPPEVMSGKNATA